MVSCFDFSLLLLLFQVEVEFGNGRMFKLSAEFLRVNSPAVDGKIRSIGGEKVLTCSNFWELRTI